MERSVFPIPEALDGRKWDVQGTARGGRIHPRSRSMFVPLDKTAQSRFVRAHELGHARITPQVEPGKVATKAGVTVESLQVCEDRRVTAFLRSAGIATTGFLTQEEVNAGIHRYVDNLPMLARTLVAYHGTEDHRRVIDAAKAYISEHFSGESYRVANARLSLAIAIANDIWRRDMKDSRLLLHKRGFRAVTVKAARQLDAMIALGSDSLRAGTLETPDRMRSLADEVANNMGLLRNAMVGGEWGKCRPPVKAPMQRRKKTDLFALARRCHDEGTVPNAMHRFASDGRIFSTRRRGAGGTILIDASGSMNIDNDMLTQFVDAAPMATVAIYAGYHHDGGIVIVAKDGKVADPSDISAFRDKLGFGNVVDGPALDWLGTQPQPRIWVCDGQVTGVGDRCHQNLAIEAGIKVRQHNVKQVPAMRHVLGMLGRR